MTFSVLTASRGHAVRVQSSAARSRAAAAAVVMVAFVLAGCGESAQQPSSAIAFTPPVSNSAPPASGLTGAKPSTPAGESPTRSSTISRSPGTHTDDHPSDLDTALRLLTEHAALPVQCPGRSLESLTGPAAQARGIDVDVTAHGMLLSTPVALVDLRCPDGAEELLVYALDAARPTIPVLLAELITTSDDVVVKRASVGASELTAQVVIPDSAEPRTWRWDVVEQKPFELGPRRG